MITFKKGNRKLAKHFGGPSEILGGYVPSDHTDPEFFKKVGELHLELFPEEYDFMLDSGADLKMRKQGVCPMSQIYLNRVNLRRVSLGVPEISGVEMSLFEESWDFCLKKVLAEQAGLDF
ncbi:MAG: hypothetical protein KAI82_06325 [Tritonibacter mobilis]|nr:hypothetical protein [Tritonibacter mobilis]